MKVYYFLAFLASSFAYGAKAPRPTGELWNKHTKPIYYSITNGPIQAAITPLKRLEPGTFVKVHRNLRAPTVFAIAIENPPEPDQRLDIFTIRPCKTLYVRVGLPSEKEKWKEFIKDIFGAQSIEADGYIFGGQVGPLLGLRGITERGYPLKNNVHAQDISPSSITFDPNQ